MTVEPLHTRVEPLVAPVRLVEYAYFLHRRFFPERERLLARQEQGWPDEGRAVRVLCQRSFALI